MKTPEDEAWEEMERKQGGGFPAKRAMAADDYTSGYERGYAAGSRKIAEGEAYREAYFKLVEHIANLQAMKPIPSTVVSAYSDIVSDGGLDPRNKFDAQPAQEQNTITFFRASSDWVMRITADRRIEVNEGVEVTEAAKKVLEALQSMLKPAQEPIAYVTGTYNGRFVVAPLNPAMVLPVGMAFYTTPPQRTWVGLTDEQRLMALKFIDPQTARLPPGFKQFAESIEQLLKDQNA